MRLGRINNKIRIMISGPDFLKTIQSNIINHGYHVTMVNGFPMPRFAYTIGCKDTFGAELIFAGGEYYSKKDVTNIISQLIKELKNGAEWQKLHLNIMNLGSFSLSEVDKTWSKLLTLGVFDYYNQNEIQILQILPDREHFTLDIPNLAQKFDSTSQPVWQWLDKDWDYPVHQNSRAVTNLRVLFGEKATEVMRWETNEWEIFSGAGPDVTKEEMRVVPLGMLLGIDKSLEPVVYSEVGKGYWRDSTELEWNNWG